MKRSILPSQPREVQQVVSFFRIITFLGSIALLGANAMASVSCTRAPNGVLFEHADIFGSTPQDLPMYNRTMDPDECCSWCQLYANCSVWTLALGEPQPYTDICFLKTNTSGWRGGGGAAISGCLNASDCKGPPLPPPPPPTNHSPNWIPWTSELPVGVPGIDPCPLPISKLIEGIDYDTHNHRLYSTADTWYPTIDTNTGLLYSSFMDGGVVTDKGKGAGANGKGDGACQGWAQVANYKDPLNMSITDAGCFKSPAYENQGRYACGQMVVNGTWFYGTYLLNGGPDKGVGCTSEHAGFAWCQMASFVGFRTSTDGGVTFDEPRMTITNVTDNIFHEAASENGHAADGPWYPIKYGAPNIVDFGANLQHSPDGKMYIVSYGSSRYGQWEEWNAADEIYLARVVPDPALIQSRENWEFYGGADVGWVYDNVTAARPIMTWNNRTGTVTITYTPLLKRYIMTVTSPTAATWPYQDLQYDTYIAEAPNIEGPYSLVTYQKYFGPQGYFVSFPSFWHNATIGPGAPYPNGTQAPDVWQVVASYAANWRGPARSNPAFQTPPGSGYGWNVQYARFRLKEGWKELI